MKEGEIVNVYQDPITNLIFEGDAKLIKKLGEDNEFEFWLVEFTDERGINYHRKFYAPKEG